MSDFLAYALMFVMLGSMIGGLLFGHYHYSPAYWANRFRREHTARLGDRRAALYFKSGGYSRYGQAGQ